MSTATASNYRTSRIAGGILVLIAALNYLQLDRVSAVAFVLGLSLLLIQDSSKLELARFVVFAWCLGSFMIVMPALISEGLWQPAVRSALLSGGVAGLMLDRLSEPVVGILCLLAAGVIYW